MTVFTDEEMVAVISDFLEQGLAENIVAMYKKDPSLHRLSGELLRDERFRVRMGVALLYEELAKVRPLETARAIPALEPLLADETAYVRGEACNLLGLIDTDESRALLAGMADDPDPQVREIVADFLA